MDEIKPVSNPVLQHNPLQVPPRLKDYSVNAAGQADKIELSLTGPMTREKAMLVYQKTVVDTFNKNMGLEDKTEPTLLAKYRAQADDGFNDLTPANWTPEKVADRILKFTLGLFGLFKSYGENDGLSNKEVLDKFKELVKSSVDEGYRQALSITGDTSEEVSSQLSRTMEIVHKGVDDWYSEQLSLLGEDSQSRSGS